MTDEGGDAVPYDDDRRALIDKLRELIGEKLTATLMESIPPNPWDQLATKTDLERFATKTDLERFATKTDLERFATKADLADLRGEFAGLRGEFGDLKGDFGDLKGEVGALRGDVGELRAEIRAITPRLLAASLGSSAALLAFVLGAAAVVR
jgi:hypothetical protein